MALTGKTNEEKIWNYLKSKGLNDYGCAGLIGNLDCESALNSKNLQQTYEKKLGFTDDSYTKAVDNGTYSNFIKDCAGYGLAQWTYWSRKQNLLNYAKSKNKSIGDLEMQLDFLYKELSEGYKSVLNTLKTATSILQASNAVLLKYERPADQSVTAQNKRASYGQKYYTKFVTNSNKEGEITMGYKYFTKGKAVKVSEHFYSTEFDCHGNGCCSQTIVNEKLIDYLEQIRNHFNAPITITSPYRCIYHNRNVVGGAVNSRHEKGDAADFVVKGHAPREVAQYAESIGIMGIGLYETKDDGYFVHIDTRDYKSFWYGQKEQKMTTFGTYTETTINTNNSSNTSVLDTILNRGDSGTAVKELQEKLIKLGYSCGERGADGSFGAKTEEAVRNFQRKTSGLAVDGIAGYQTLTAIDNAIASLDGNSKVKITANVLNVRSGAGMNYPVVSNVRKGSIYTLIEQNNGWGKISNPVGWISLEYTEKI